MLPLILTITGMGVLAFSVIVPALPDLADELGVSRGSIGLVGAAVSLPGIFLAAYIGYLTDRLGRRQVIRASLFVFGAAGLACYFARSYWALVALRAAQGLGTSGLLSLGVVVIGDLFTGHERRWAMGLNLAALTGMTTIAPIVGGLLAEGGAFRPFLVFVVAFPVWWWARLLPGRPDGAPAAPPLRHAGATLASLRRSGRLSDWLGMLPMSFVTIGVFLGVATTVTPLFLEHEWGLSVSQRGLIAAVGSAASSTASILSGRIGRRFPPSRVLPVAFGLIVTGFVLVGSSPALWQVALGLAVIGSGTGSIFPLLQTYAASAVPAEYRGASVGMWVTANRLGQFSGPTAATAIAASVGDRETYFGAAGIMAVVAMVWVPMRRWAQRRSAAGDG
ncbi:MAG: MFS transporter [Actinobacteria bacterium]|nr:MFS transporter [Actinomycetota bacterium]